jgi:hypothetical protein
MCGKNLWIVDIARIAANKNLNVVSLIYELMSQR